MRKIVVILFMMLCPVISVTSQHYNLGHRQITFVDAEREDRTVLTEIYYPAFSDGEGVPVANDMGVKFPVIVFGHGFVMEWGAYANFWNSLVPNGYIMAFPRTETGLSPDHATFARDLAYLVSAMQQEGETAGSPFFGVVDTTSCVMGHSMGGGSSFLAKQYNSKITALANFAAAETNPSAIEACQAIQVPVLMFAGANDCITTPDAHQIPMFDALPASCKTLVTITGASHCQFAQQNVFCSFGELSCTLDPTITRETQQSIVDTMLLPWLDYQLKGECSGFVEFQNILESAMAWTFDYMCEPCIPVFLHGPPEESEIRLYPIPAKGNFYLEAPPDFEVITVKIYTSSGQTIFQEGLTQDGQGRWLVDTDLSPGMYYVEVASRDMSVTLKLVAH
jgi:pimeloyl-ACP methyl ester carboxylesterase